VSLADLALAAVGLALLFLAAELAARVLLPRLGRYYVWPPHARVHMTTDREAVPELEPLVRVEINRDGERGGEPPDDWSDTYRVLVAGGSVVECWYLDQPSAWPQVIERCLNEPASLAKLGVSRAHVGSVGKSLVACEHIGRMLERIRPRYPRLDAIVLLVGASDLVDWLEKRTPPSIDRADVPLSAVFGQHPEPPFGWTPRTLALRRIVSSLRRRVRRRITRRGNVGRSIARARAARANAVTILRTVPDPTPMLDRFEKDLRELVALAKSMAGRVILARQPWLEKEFTPEEERRLWMFGAGRVRDETVTDYYAHAVVWELMRKIDERVVKVAQDLRVEQLDLRPVVPPTFELWYDEMHHNARGCERIGRALARKIAGEG
jgi:lysophospholipase L1-like esterase